VRTLKHVSAASDDFVAVFGAVNAAVSGDSASVSAAVAAMIAAVSDNSTGDPYITVAVAAAFLNDTSALS
jgi:hypothetical protein